MPDKLVIVDPCFHSFDGHQFNYFKGINEVARRRGLAVHVVANGTSTDVVRNTFATVPAFEDLGIEYVSDFSTDQSINFNYNAVHFNNRFFINLTNATNHLPPLNAQSVVFFATTSFRHLLAIVSWLDLFPEAGRPKAVLLLRDRDYMPERNSAIYRMTLQILASPRFGARFCSEAPIVARQFSELANVRVDTIPVPVDARNFRNREGGNIPGEITVAFLGQARLSKGFQLLPDLSQRVLSGTPQTKIMVQTQIGQFDPNHDAIVDATLARLRPMVGPRLKLLEGSLSYEAYLDVLFASDIVILPYDPQTYRESASAVLVEALAAGKIVVLPRGTSIAAVAAQAGAGCVTFDGHGPGSIADAVAEAIARFDELKATANRARAAWIESHDVGRVVDYLCAASA